jgi:hypothetical protein
MGGPLFGSTEISGEKPMNENKNFADKTPRAARETFRELARLRSNPPEARSKAFLRSPKVFTTSTSD